MYEENEGLVDVGFSSACSHPDLRERLLAKSAAARKAREESGWTEDMAVKDEDRGCDENLCCACSNCGYVFYRADASEHFTCPRCRAKHHFEPASELDGFSAGNRMDAAKMIKLLQKNEAAERRRTTSVIRGTMTDTHTNTAKGQASLQMGSAEYREYLRDIEASDPAKPSQVPYGQAGNDEMAGLVEISVQDPNRESFMERKMRLEYEKRDVHDLIIDSVKLEVAATPSEDDDALLACLLEDNPILTDMSVTGGEYADVLEDCLGL